MARPKKINTELIERALILRDKGYTLEDIALALGINECTLYDKTSEEWTLLRKQLNVIKAAQDLEGITKVKNALIKRAVGYNVKEKTEIFDENGEVTGTSIKSRHVPGDVKAQQFYLTNRDPDNWKMQQDNDSKVDKTDNELKIIISQENE